MFGPPTKKHFICVFPCLLSVIGIISQILDRWTLRRLLLQIKNMSSTKDMHLPTHTRTCVGISWRLRHITQQISVLWCTSGTYIILLHTGGRKSCRLACIHRSVLWTTGCDIVTIPEGWYKDCETCARWNSRAQEVNCSNKLNDWIWFAERRSQIHQISQAKTATVEQIIYELIISAIEPLANIVNAHLFSI